MSESLKELSERFVKAKNRVTDIGRDLAEAKKVKEDYENRLIQAMQAVGLTQIGNQDITMSVRSDTVPNIKDWDAVYQYIHDNHAYHLLQRRMSSTAYKELVELGEVVPGTEEFDRISISTKNK